MMHVNANQLHSYADLQKVKMDWSLAILNLLFLQTSYAINVGVGISDITGPAAEVGMVSFTGSSLRFDIRGIHIYTRVKKDTPICLCII